MAEMWDIYDKYRRPKNKLHQRGLPMEEGDYHIVVNIWVIGTNGSIILSKRHPDKLDPLKWECTGGSVCAGESSRLGAARELGEEIGIHVSPEELIPVRSYKRKYDFLDVYLLFSDIPVSELVYQETEVVAAKRVSIDTLTRIRRDGNLVSGLDYFWDLYNNYVH